MIEKVAVIGQGYVGFPLSVAAASAGYQVVGIDTNESHINSIKFSDKESFGVSRNLINELISSNNLVLTNDFSQALGVSILLICVPTPINEKYEPDLKYLLGSLASIGPFFAKTSMLIIESTIAPYTVRRKILPLMSRITGISEEEIQIVYSPERIDPGNQKWKISNTPKLVAGLKYEHAKRAQEFYQNFISEIVLCDSIEIAETSKLLENTFRFVNISFINEFKTICDKMEIDLSKVIQAAATKPHGFMPFFPSLGAGGHCIPVDPHYLAQAAKEFGASTKFIDLSHDINKEMPEYFVRKVEEKFGALFGKNLLVLGVAFKPNIPDARETPVGKFILQLRSRGANVDWHDNLVKNWNSETSKPIIGKYDLALIATPHDNVDLTNLAGIPVWNITGLIN
jgi:UDP-N-acetyl-D-glucosamine dehydrogenase